MKNIDFLLENKHYRRLHIILYLISVLIIVIVYFVTLLIFSKFVNMVITSIASFVIGLYIVLSRESIIKRVSDLIEGRKREKYKQQSHQNLKSTLRNIAPKPKRKLKFSITKKVSVKEHFERIKSKLKGEGPKKRQGYIEVK